MSEADELLDIEQAAKFLNVSETSLRRWTNAGRLACLRVGRRRERRFRRADLLAFMEDQPAGAHASAPRSSSPHQAHTLWPCCPRVNGPPQRRVSAGTTPAGAVG